MSDPKTRLLPVKLNDEEMRQRATELGRVIGEHADVEAEKKAAATHAKERLESLDTQISQLGRIVRTGEEYREVPVSYVRRYERSTVEVMRQDTGEIVDSRPMTEDERQQGLFDEEEQQPEKRRKAKTGTAA